jgi:pSer/pThr/pTyr-binding forkhead associated (FHA) protein
VFRRFRRLREGRGRSSVIFFPGVEKMVVIAWKQRSHLVQGHAAGDLYLRVVGTARDGQVIRLSGSKCTIGSAEGCTLRLRSRGVRPLHCVILRGLRGTAARSWAAGTRLNGRSFSDTLLIPGDRLTIGPVNFEVLDAISGEQSCLAQAARLEAINKQSELKSTNSGSAGRLRAQVARARVRRLVAALREIQSEVAELREQRSRATVDDLSARAVELDLARQQQDALDRHAREELQKAIAIFDAERNAWAVEIARMRAELDVERAALAGEREQAARALHESEQQRGGLRTDIQSQRSQLAQEQADWQARHAAEESRLAEERNRLDAERMAIARAEEEYHELLAAATQEQAQTTAEVLAARADLEKRRIEAEQQLADRTALLDSRRAELERRGSELEATTGKGQQRLSAIAKAEADVRVAAEELAKRRAEFEAGQAAAQKELEHHAAAQQGAQREALEIVKAMSTKVQSAEAGLADRERELNDKGAALKAQAAELDERAASLERGEAKCHADQLACDSLKDEIERQSRAASKQLNAEQDAWKKNRAALESEDQARRSQLDATHDELKKQQACIERQAAQIAQQQAALDGGRQSVQQDRETLEVERAEFDRNRKEWQMAHAELSAETRAALFAERATLALVRQAWEADQTTSADQLARHAAELDERERQLTVQAKALVAGHGDREAPAALDRRLQAERSDLDASRSEFERDRQAWQASRAQSDARYSQQLERLEEQLTQLQKREDELESERGRLARTEQEQQETAQSLAERAADLESREHRLRTEIEEREERLREEQMEWHNREQADVRAGGPGTRSEVEDDDEPSESPATYRAARDEAAIEDEEDQEVASREELTDDDQEVAEFEEDVQDAPLRDATAGQPASDEQSIEDYMAALFTRMRGGSPSEPVIIPQQRPRRRRSETPPPEERPKSETAPRDVTSGEVVDMPMGAAELSRRSAPADLTDLTAMRELANTQAQIAIATHGNKRLLKTAARAWGTGLGCLAVTFFVWTFAPTSSLTLRTGSAIGIVAGIYWMVLGLIATQKLIVIRQKQKKSLRASLEEAAAKKPSQPS